MAMLNESSDVSDDCILYELLVYSEWKQDPEFVKFSKPTDAIFYNATSRYSPQRLLQFFSWRNSVSTEILRLLLHHLPWQFAVGEGGKVVAILQESSLEIRTSRDEYCSVVGRATVPRDPVPHWRKLAWSPDCSMLAVSHSNGSVSFYDLLGSNLFNIYPPKFQQDAQNTDHGQAIASVIFLNSRIKTHKWSCELLVTNYLGQLRGYLVSPTDGFQENHVFNFSQYYPQGVVALAYHPNHNMLFIAGPSNLFSSALLKGFGCSMGLSAWRLLNDHPYYRPALSLDEEDAIAQAQHSLWNWVPLVGRKSNKSIIFKMKISPNGSLLACLHSCGSISLWHLPAIRLFKFWRLYEQPCYNAVNPQADKQTYRVVTGDVDSEYYPVDINWWADQAIIVARFSGALSVYSVTNLRNLLGESPEFLAGQPRVSAVCGDQGFLGLECEAVLTTKKWLCEDDSIWEAKDSSEEDEEDTENESLLDWSTALVQSAVYSVTDMERFQPKRKRPKVLLKTYRLVGLKKTTPEELYARKIDNEEYTDALELALAYNLDCDLVYQRQWRNSKVSISTIHDFLSKVRKRSWVLKECIERVPESLTATRELLQYGLRITNLETLVAIGEGSDGGHFVLADDAPEQADARKKVDSNILGKVDVNALTEDQMTLIKYRQKLLQYLDKLTTYEIILGGSDVANSLYDHVFYDKFRLASTVASTVEFARDGNWQAVGHMLTYHGGATLPHWLPVLSSFPESMSPLGYKSLLPECGADGEVFCWHQKQLRARDWCEGNAFMCVHRQLQGDEDEDLKLVYEGNASLQQFVLRAGDRELTRELVSAWYVTRIQQVEQYSRIVEHALTLIKLAMERNIAGLDMLYSQMLTLDTLVYDVHVESMDLSTLQKMSDLEVAKLLMSKTSEGTFVEDLHGLLLPFLGRCEQRALGARRQLLRELLLDLSSRDLVLPLRLFEHLRDSGPDALVPSLEEAMSLVLDCLYACPGADQLGTALLVLECVPARNHHALHTHHSLVTSSLHDQLDELESELAAAEILNRYDLPKPLSFIHDIKSNTTDVQKLLTKLARTLMKRVPPPSEPHWQQLLNNMLYLQSKVFPCISTEACYQIYVATLLSSGSKANIMAASNILQCRCLEQNNKKISFEHSVALVIQAAMEYFDSAGSLLDPTMELAKSCLNLIVDDHDEVKEKLDLIASLQLLNDFGLSMLPLQVRLCTERMKLVESCVRKRPSAYRSCRELLELAQKLRVAGTDGRHREAQVLALVAETAFEAKDYAYCAQLCQRIAKKSHMLCWPVVQKLGQCEDFPDIQLRSSLLSFALLHCTPNEMEKLITTKCRLEAQLLHQAVSSQVQLHRTQNDQAEDEEFADALTSPVSPRKEFPPKTSLLHVVEDSREVIMQTTYNVLRHIGDKNFWENTFGWVKGSQDSVSDSYDQDQPFVLQGVPEFYGSLYELYHASRLSIKYDSFSVPSISDRVLVLCQNLLRITLLEENTGNLGKQHAETTDVLLQLAEHILPEDNALGLSHLMALDKPQLADRCFRNLPVSIISAQLACYFFALRVCNTLDEFEGDMFLYSPSEVVEYALGLALEEPCPDECLRLLLEYQNLLADHAQGCQLRALDCGVDLQRFSDDDQYRQDTILGLAMTEDEERFLLAMRLGSRYGVPPAHIATCHASVLLTSGGTIPLPDLISRLTNEKLVELLKKEPQHVCNRLQQDVLPCLDGKDHQLLVLYFTLLGLVCPDSAVHALVPREHLKLIKKVKATSQKIDYLLLIDPSSNVLDALKPVISRDNVGLVAKLVKSLHQSLSCSVQVGVLYSTLAQKEFFEVEGQLAEDGWLQQFEKCSVHFPKMAPADVLSWVAGTCFVERSLEVMTVECRKELVLRAAGLCSQRAEPENEWDSCIKTLKEWLMHLETMSKHQLDNVTNLNDPHFRQLYRLLDLSRGEPSSVDNLLQKAIQSPVSLETLRCFLSMLPEPGLQLESMLLDYLKKALDMRVMHEDEGTALLNAVLLRLNELVDQEDSFLLEDDDEATATWLQLEQLCGDLSLSAAVRLNALQLLQKVSRLAEDDDDSALLYNHTQAVVATAWPDTVITVQLSDVDSGSARAALFERLAGRADSWAHITLLHRLLERWPLSDVDSFAPWITFISILLQFHEDEESIATVLEDIFKKHIFSEQHLQAVIDRVNNSAPLNLLLLVCLLSDHVSLHDKAVALIHSASGDSATGLSQKVLALVLRRGLLPRLVSSAAYPSLAEHALGTPADVPALACQLSAAGHVPEAGMLRLLHAGAPAALATFSTALALDRSCAPSK